VKFAVVAEADYVIFGIKVVVEKRPDDWMAFSVADRGVWECAATPDKAVEKLLKAHPELGDDS